MKNQTFGVEIEFTGITRSTAAEAIAKVLGTSERYIGGTYSAYEVRGTDGRRWNVVSDSSIRATKKDGTVAGNDYRCEMVTPICRYEDIEKVQEIVRAIRKAGGKVNESCGLHIHIGADGHTAKSLRNLASIMASKETLLFKALGVGNSRSERWCKKVEGKMLDKMQSKRPKTIEEVKEIWYNGDDGSWEHYHSSRYHALNLHSVFQKGTVELRMFNSTLHAGKVKAYIQLALAISNQAKVQRGASRKETTSTNEKFTFRTWLIRLGLNGEEFKTARLHLLANLDGNSAWRYPEAA
ncbi:MAG: amidoligase family protein [Bacillota bacterium]